MAILDNTIKSVHSNSERWRDLPQDEQIRNFLHTYFESNDKNMVCLMGALSSSFEELPAEMQMKLKEMGEVILTWVRSCLEKGRMDGVFVFDEEPDVKATMLVSNMLSSLLLARVLGKGYFDTIYKQVLTAI